jgi:predicted dehydrogenase
MVRVCIIGSSGHNNYALEGVRAFKDADITGIAPGTKEEDISGLAQTGQQEFSSNIYDTYEEMLEREKPDIAVVNSHFYLNAEIASLCMEKGIHVFCEKPVALTLDDLNMLQETYTASGVQFAAMHAYRYESPFPEAYKAFTTGVIGDPILITAQKSYKLGTNRKDFFKKRKTYGGTIPWVGSHSIDWIYWFTQGKLESVYASHTTAGNRGHDELESSGVCLFTISGGGQAVTNIDYFRPQKAATHGDDRLRVAGGKGVIEVMKREATLVTHDAEEQVLKLEEEKEIFADFMLQTEHKGTCRVTAEDSFAVTRLCLLAQESADTGNVIDLT